MKQVKEIKIIFARVKGESSIEIENKDHAKYAWVIDSGEPTAWTFLKNANNSGPCIRMNRDWMKETESGIKIKVKFNSKGSARNVAEEMAAGMFNNGILCKKPKAE